MYHWTGGRAMENGLVNKEELEQIRLEGENGKAIKFVAAPATISNVPAWSLGAELGLSAGDKILEINGAKLRDVMDLQMALSGTEELEILVKHQDGELEIIELEKDAEEDLGVEYETPLFNGVRECANACPFCFIDQQPLDHTRETLHLKDDDYRLSYLHGSYVTLTNLSHSDRQRIEELRPGPLYVSVHATDPDARNILLGRKKSIPILEELAWLNSLDIPVHTQIVLCPGINDGEILRQTINDLYKLKNKPVVSVAIVPLGLTKYHPGNLRRHNFEEALETVEMIGAWEEEHGTGFVFLSDELYLMTGTEVPDRNYYGDYPQLEDGVGMTRLFLNEVETELEKFSAPAETLHKKYTWLNGTIATNVIKNVARQINSKFDREIIEPVFIESKFWGTTNVSGLLTGKDILEALVGKEIGDAIIIPSVMLKEGEDIFLDDMHISEFAKKIGKPCYKAWGAEELLNCCSQNTATVLQTQN